MLLVYMLDSGDDVFGLALGKSNGSSAAAVDGTVALQLRNSGELLDVQRLHRSRTGGFGLLDSLRSRRDKVTRGST